MSVRIETDVRRAGEAKAAPFLVLVVNNPVLETADGSGVFYPDPLPPGPEFEQAAAHIEAALWGELEGQVESAFIEADLAARARLEVVSVHGAPVAAEWAFVTHLPGMLAGRQPAIAAFARGLGQAADIVFVLTASTQQSRASAWYGTDDRRRGADVFELEADGLCERFRHAYWPSNPGTVAMHVTERSITPVHEFGHAISTRNAKDAVAGEAVNGLITDLYVDAPLGLNKRVVRPPSAGFATYRTAGRETRHDWDPDRTVAGGYDADWISYHCAASDPDLPPIMDNYFRAGARQHACRHDTITREFIRDRVAARMKR